MSIALLEINGPITFSKRVQPICIAAAADNNYRRSYDDKIAMIAGWGQMKEDLDVSKYNNNKKYIHQFN